MKGNTALELRRQTWYADIIMSRGKKTHTCCRATTAPIERQRGVFIHKSKTDTPNDDNNDNNNNSSTKKSTMYKSKNMKVYQLERNIGTENISNPKHFFHSFLCSIENWPQTLISYVLYSSLWCSFVLCRSCRQTCRK